MASRVQASTHEEEQLSVAKRKAYRSFDQDA